MVFNVLGTALVCTSDGSNNNNNDNDKINDNGTLSKAPISQGGGVWVGVGRGFVGLKNSHNNTLTTEQLGHATSKIACINTAVRGRVESYLLSLFLSLSSPPLSLYIYIWA